MNRMQKWDYATHSYVPYEVPEGWNCPLYGNRMNDTINCASCGKEITFGDSYSSRVIQNSIGLGFNVCEECMEKEVAAEIAARKERTE